MDALQLLVMPVLAALLEGVKRIPPIRRYLDAAPENSWFLPWAAGALGAGLLVAWCAAYPPAEAMAIGAQLIQGAIMGLAAAGIYRGSIGPLRAAVSAPFAGPPAIFLVLAGAVCLAGMAGGCAAPQSVRDAQAFEAETLHLYINNQARIGQAWATVYGQAREADIQATTDRVIASVQAQAAAGALSPDQVGSAIRLIVSLRDDARAGTASVIARMAALDAANRREAMAGLQIHSAMAEYLAAGADESAIPDLVAQVLAAVKEVRGAAAPPAPSPPAATPAASK